MSPREVEAAELDEEDRWAVLIYAKVHGRYWKAALRWDWERARYPAVDHIPKVDACLQSIRNRLGPTWLNRVKLADVAGGK